MFVYGEWRRKIVSVEFDGFSTLFTLQLFSVNLSDVLPVRQTVNATGISVDMIYCCKLMFVDSLL